jgi:hypothetical protein
MTDGRPDGSASDAIVFHGVPPLLEPYASEELPPFTPAPDEVSTMTPRPAGRITAEKCLARRN